MICMWPDGTWCEVDDLYLHRDKSNDYAILTVGQASIALDLVIEDLFPTIH